MARRNNGKRWALGFGVAAAIAGAAGWVLFTTLSKGPEAGNKVASIVSALVALGGLAVTLSSTLSRTRSSSDETPSTVDVTAGQLANSVRSLSAREEEHRRIGDPRPLSVQWDTASEDVGDRWENIHGTAGQDRDEPMSLAGGFASIRETYEAVPSGRLVILGRAGAGKTVLVHRLILALLEEQDRAGPVPVLFSLSDWDPTALGLRDWMVRQLVRDFPFLDARDPTGKSRAQLLVEADRILPVLDGFDEIPACHHPDAIDGISRFRGQLVVTSRPDEYANAARAVRPLSSAVAIELADLTLDETRRYLQASTNKSRAADWDAVFDHLRTAPDTAASQNLTPVLTSPLMVMLARTTYNDAEQHDPQELLNATRFPTRAALEERLLDKTLTTLYDPRHTTQRPGEPASPKYDPDRARHWLGYLATHLTKRNTHDLNWWHLPNSLPRHTRILIATTTLTLAFGLGGGFVGMLDHWPSFDLMGLGWGLNYGFASGVAALLTVGLPVGLAVGLINELEVPNRRTGREPERLRLRPRRRDRTHRPGFTSPKQAASDFTIGLTIGFAVGLTVGPASELAFVFKRWIVDEGAYTTMYGFSQYFARTPLSGLAVGLAFGLVNVVVSVFGDNHDTHGAITPWQLLSTDRTVTLVRTIATVLMITLVYGLAFWLKGGLVNGYWGRLEDGFADGLLFGLVVGMVRLGLSSWGRWLIFSRLWLPVTRRLPWRPKRFLEDAYRRGVLRQAGAVYQFRHAQLRDHLARRYRNQPRSTPPAETSAHDGLSPAPEPH